MSSLDITRNEMDKTTMVTATIGDDVREIEEIREAIRKGIVVKLVDKFVEEHGTEILSSIDLDTIKAKTNETVTVQALKELIKS